MPGVELHAQAIEQILQGAFLQRPDFATPAELLYILVLGTAHRLADLSPRGRSAAPCLGGIAVAAVVGVSWYAFDAFGWLVDPIYPAIALDRDLSRRHRVRVPAHRAGAEPRPPRLLATIWRRRWSSALADDPSRLKLGGETRDMTLLFCDVRGFTTHLREAWTPRS